MIPSILASMKRYLGTFTLGREEAANGADLEQFAKAIIDTNEDVIALQGDVSSLASTSPGTILTTKGDLLTHDGSTIVRKPVGVDDTILTADSTTSDGLDYKAPSYFAGLIPVEADQVTVIGDGTAASKLEGTYVQNFLLMGG